MKKAGTYGEQVAARFKEQHYSKDDGWVNFDFWDIKPEEMHTILLELKSKKAVQAILNYWVKNLKKPGSVIKSRGKK